MQTHVDRRGFLGQAAAVAAGVAAAAGAAPAWTEAVEAAPVQPSVGRRMQRTWLNFATAELGEDWPRYDATSRRTRVIRSTRDDTVDDPDAIRRSAWDGLY